MNIAIVGYGKMGRMIESVAHERKLNIVSTIDPFAKDAKFREINAESLAGVDVAVDFTAPDTILKNIKLYCSLGVNAVIGTTGWYDHISAVKKQVKKAGIGLIWSGNFSIGVNLLFRIVADACRVMDKIPEYDAFAYELHHSAKKDSPSGTAEMLGSIMLKNLSSKKKLVTARLDRARANDELHFASVRGGNIPGTHVIGFDSLADTIEIKHTARSRYGFALGAVMAAEWLKSKEGFFIIDDFMDDLIN